MEKQAENTTKKHAPMSNTETAAFCSQMAMVLKSGISYLEGIAFMLEDAKNPEEERLLQEIYDTCMMGESFYIALEETKSFPGYMVSMVRIGEMSGRLDEVMGSLAEYYEKEEALAQTVKNAITYPFVMILMMVAVIIVLLTKVMPIFDQVFRQLGTEMTGISRVILSIGNVLSAHSAVVVVVMAALVVCGIYLLKTKAGQAKLLQWTGKFNVTRMLSDQISVYRFASGMSLSLSSGLTPEQSLELTEPLLTDPAFREKLAQCKERVGQGEDLCDVLLACGVFSGVYTRVAKIAGRTGAMDEAMAKIAARYGEEIDTKIESLLAGIEPTLVVVLSVIVGVILLSIMLPLMSIMAAL